MSGASRAGLRIAEVPSNELTRISGNSNLHTFRDGWRVLRTLARECIGWDAPTAGARAEALRRVKYKYPELLSRMFQRIPRRSWASWRVNEMSHSEGLPAVSVVICSYTEDRWDMLMAAVESVRTQTVPPQQTIVVVDYNMDLYKRLISTVPDVVILENNGPKGLSGARNTGAAAATAEIVAFLDDDAEAEPDWLERLTALYDDHDVLAVGGRVVPHVGNPASRATSPKNSTGSSAARTAACPRSPPRFATSSAPTCRSAPRSWNVVGGFNTSLGRQNSLPLGV